jgi:hypothetical protein
LSDRDFISTGEFVVYPNESPAEVIETALIVPGDDDAAPGESAEAGLERISLTWNGTDGDPGE